MLGSPGFCATISARIAALLVLSAPVNASLAASTRGPCDGSRTSNGESVTTVEPIKSFTSLLK